MWMVYSKIQQIPLHYLPGITGHGEPELRTQITTVNLPLGSGHGKRQGTHQCLHIQMPKNLLRMLWYLECQSKLYTKAMRKVGSENVDGHKYAWNKLIFICVGALAFGNKILQIKFVFPYRICWWGGIMVDAKVHKTK